MFTLPMVCEAQIKTRNVVEYNPKQELKYDSLANVPYPEMSIVIGQKVVVFDTYDFFIHKNFENLSVRKLRSEYYIIKDIMPLAGNKTTIRFIGKEKEDTIYLSLYNDLFFDKAPFIVVGYYEKMKKEYIGKEFSLYSYGNFIDINTGMKKEFNSGEIFTCTDITLLSNSNLPAAILKSSQNDEIAAILKGFKSLQDYPKIFNFNLQKETRVEKSARQTKENEEELSSKAKEKEELEKRDAQYKKDCIAKFGQKYGLLVYVGDVAMGMTKEMCRAAWGEPDHINKTTTKNGKHEQWVYSLGNYLYFDNNILTEIQNKE